MDLNTTKELAGIAAPFTGLIINTFLKPALENVGEKFRKSRKKPDFDVIDKFQDYLNRAYERQAYIKTLVFQNSKKLLQDLYVPLTVMNFDTEATIKVASYPKQFLPVNERVLLVDTAGMGKSTLSRFLFLKCIEENIGIPILLELRQLREGAKIVDLISNDINKIDEVFDRELLLSLISRGDFVFFFDGFDEIPLKDREAATIHLQEFIAKAPNNKYLVTSRPDPALAAFADFQKFIIKHLQQSEAFSLLEKYDVAGTIAPALIEKLKEEQHRGNLKSFLTNPLLVSLLFKAYDFKPTLPLRADVFYRQVYDALFENHDLAKGGSFIREKKTRLNIDDFSRVLRAIAIKTVVLGKVEYNHDELLGIIGEAKSKCSGLNFADSDFIKDLIVTVPIFVQEGLDYRWSHKSFQEYFAALYVAVDAKGNADKFLEKFTDSKEQLRFVNILELYYDIDTVTFNRALTKRLIEEFIAYDKGDAYSQKYIGVAKDDISTRKLICFGREYILFSSDSINKLANEDIKFDPTRAHNTIRIHVEKTGLVPNGYRIGSSTIYPNGSALLVLQKPNILVMEILSRKRNKLVFDVRLRAYRNGSRNYGLMTPSNIISGNEPRVVTEDNSNFLNSDQNFGKVTYLIVDNERVRISIDLEVSEEMLTEIQRLSAEDSVDDILRGI